MSDAEAVRSLIAATASLANESAGGNETAIENWVRTFATDGSCVVDRYTNEGHEQLRAFHRAVIGSGHSFAKHFVGASVVAVEGSTASGHTDFLLIGKEPAWSIVGAGHYDDVFRKREGRWGEHSSRRKE
jgi:hypothetical protein